MTTNVDDLRLIGIKDAAAVLGISENTLRQWVCYRQFPYVKVGRRTLIALKDLVNFIDGNRVAARTGKADT